MSKPVLEDLFRFSGRRNRKSYLLFLLAMAVWLAIVAATVGLVAGSAAGEIGRTLALALGGLLVIPSLVASWAVGAQRCRDFGWTGWAALLTLIPYLGALFALAILFIPGNVGPNRYGPDPLGVQPAY